MRLAITPEVADAWLQDLRTTKVRQIKGELIDIYEGGNCGLGRCFTVMGLTEKEIHLIDTKGHIEKFERLERKELITLSEDGEVMVRIRYDYNSIGDEEFLKMIVHSNDGQELTFPEMADVIEGIFFPERQGPIGFRPAPRLDTEIDASESREVVLAHV